MYGKKEYDCCGPNRTATTLIKNLNFNTSCDRNSWIVRWKNAPTLRESVEDRGLWTHVPPRSHCIIVTKAHLSTLKWEGIKRRNEHAGGGLIANSKLDEAAAIDSVTWRETQPHRERAVQAISWSIVSCVRLVRVEEINVEVFCTKLDLLFSRTPPPFLSLGVLTPKTLKNPEFKYVCGAQHMRTTRCQKMI